MRSPGQLPHVPPPPPSYKQKENHQKRSGLGLLTKKKNIEHIKTYIQQDGTSLHGSNALSQYFREGFLFEKAN